MRPDGRLNDQLRPCTMERGFAKFAEGSCLIKIGDTHVLVTATVDDGVPRFKKGSGSGWLTAEYAMLPRSGRQRNQRDNQRPNGRSLEIQRLIGRSMRSVVDLSRMGERTITLDCDAIQADGGTRTAAITGAWIALYDCIAWMKKRGMITKPVLTDQVAAISCGIVGGEPVLDLNYDEDSTAETDMNLVMTGTGGIIEIQGTAEKKPFTTEEMTALIELARGGIRKLVDMQKMTVA